jgi:hypothetical protein
MRPRSKSVATCQHCAHFVDDPACIETELSNLTVLGSAYSSVRGDAGICQKRGRFMDPVPALDCAEFTARGQPDGHG